MVAVLGTLAFTLLVFVILLWDLNSRVILPAIIQEMGTYSLTDKNIGTYLGVLTGIVALLFPISLSIISDSKGKYFSSQEVTEVMFKQCEYKGMYYLIVLLIALTIVSFWEPLPKLLIVLMLIAMIGSLVFLFFFFRKLEDVISDFSQLVRKEEKSNIQKLLKNE